ncbi:MAG: NAD(P)-dependent oxidoreductase [Gemmatimonadales bacterium]
MLALALTPRTRKLISHAELAAMQRDAWLVNVARGPVVDNRALIDALRSGQIGGAALDVTDPEPLPAGHPCARPGRAGSAARMRTGPAWTRVSMARRSDQMTERFPAPEIERQTPKNGPARPAPRRTGTPDGRRHD